MGTNYFFSVIFLLGSFCLAQEYSIHTIDSDLTNNAKAVVRLDKTELTLSTQRSLKVEKEYIISIFRKDGLAFMFQPIYYDNHTRINRYEADIYNQHGDLIKKLRRKDFKDLSATQSGTLYAENRVLIADYTPTEYPFTIAYKYVYNTSNTAFIPNWTPIEAYNLGVEKSIYSFDNSSAIETLTKKLNFQPYSNIEFQKDGNNFQYILTNQIPKLKEILAPPLIEEVPRLLVSPTKFHLAGHDGQFSNWEDFGKWFYDDLIKGRQDLPEEEKIKVKELTAGVNSTKEKVRVLYQYMQNKTRYINVAIGIGGWQPYPAQYVSQKGYGDCKALSNYMMALLEEAGIDSNFTIVYGDSDTNRNIISDFPSMQGNHAILNVPLEGDTIWLECTNQIIAFNHLGTFTNDRYALSLGPNGGKIVKTQSFPVEKNKQIIDGKGVINQEGHLELSFTHTTTGIQYDSNYGVYYINEVDQKNWLNSKYDNIKSKKFDSFEFINDQNNATFIQNINLTSDAYGRAKGNNLIFPIIPVGNYDTNIKKDSDRKQPIQIQNGFIDKSIFTFEIPTGYTMNYEFTPIQIDSPFGSYVMSYHLKDNMIWVKRELQVTAGLFNQDQFAAYVDFRRSIEKADNTKALLEKIKL